MPQIAPGERALRGAMRTLVSLTLITSLVSSLTQGVSAAPAPRSIDSFGAKLHGQLDAAKGNLVYSPASIAIALAMTREGARDTTAAEMDAVLGAKTGAEARALLAVLGKPAGKVEPGMPQPPELSIANRLFGERTTPFERAFLDLTRDGYGAALEPMDFKRHHEDARAAINGWVAKQTKDRIKDLLRTGTVAADTRLVLVNAIYLKAQWATPFEVSATQPSKFTIEGAGNKQVSTMRTQARATWGSYGGARMVDLPYSVGAGGPRLSMMVVVPDTAKLGAVEDAYAKDGFAPFLAAATSHGKVNVALPKFKFGTDFDLGDSLQALGMKRAFTDKAEFPGISSKLPTKISKVIHKAWIAVDEKGTEAAAATAVVMSETTSVAIDKIHDFPVDRSFLFFIHDAEGNVLFGGRVIDPS
jgi:serpin B